MSRKKLFKDEELLHKSMLLFWQQGYANTSMKDIEQTLGLTAPSIYNTFGNKQALFEKSIQFYFEHIIRPQVAELQTSHQDPVQALEAFFNHLIQGVDAGKPLGCLLTKTSTEPQQVSILVKSHIKQVFSFVRSAFVQNITLMQLAGRLRQDACPEHLADNLLLSYQGLQLMIQLGYVQSQLQTYVSACLNGLGPYLLEQK